MELHRLSLIPVFTTFIVLIFFISKLVRISTRKTSNSHSPPQPWTLPLIGNLHQLASSAPHRALRDLSKKYGPLMSLQLGEVSAVIVSSPEVAKEVMKTNDLIFSSRPHFIATKIASYDSKSMAFAPYGDYWKTVRKISTMKLMSAKQVMSFKPIREDEIENLIKSISSKAGNSVDLTEKISLLMFNIIMKTAFGKTVNDPEHLMSVLSHFIELVSGFSVGDLFPSLPFLHVISGVKPKLEACRDEVDKVLETIINDHENDIHQNGLIPALMELQNDPELHITSDHVKAVLLDFMLAGKDTAGTTINWAMAEMMKNPDVLEKVQTEIRRIFDEKGSVDESEIHKLKYLNSVIKEVLRLHPPGALIPRKNSETCVINGYEIPAKTKILINAWAIGRDSKYWNEPEKFRPERFIDSSVQFAGNDFHYIPFGAGRRICPGITFGMISIEYVVANMMFHFDWKLANGMNATELDMSEAFGGTVEKKERLVLVPRPYSKSSIATLNPSP